MKVRTKQKQIKKLNFYDGQGNRIKYLKHEVRYTLSYHRDYILVLKGLELLENLPKPFRP